MIVLLALQTASCDDAVINKVLRISKEPSPLAADKCENTFLQPAKQSQGNYIT